MESKIPNNETPGAPEPMAMLDAISESGDSSDGSRANYSNIEIELGLDCENPNEEKEVSKEPKQNGAAALPEKDSVGNLMSGRGATKTGILIGGTNIRSYVEDEETTVVPPNNFMDDPKFHALVSQQKDVSEEIATCEVESLLSLLVCPITNHIFRDPCTLLADGWTYERGALITWLQFGYDISPTTGEKLYGSAFADCRCITRLISKLKPNLVHHPQFQLAWLRNRVRKHYESLTSSPSVEQFQDGVSAINLAEAAGQPQQMSAPMKNLRSPIEVKTVNSTTGGLWQRTNSIISMSREPQPYRYNPLSPGLLTASYSLPAPKKRESDPAQFKRQMSCSFVSSGGILGLQNMGRGGSYNREREFLEVLSKYPLKGTWTMEENTNFWFVRLDDEWQGDEFRNWIVHQIEATCGDVTDQNFHKLAMQWAEKLNMPPSCIGWFTPPYYGDLKIPIQKSIKNPSKEFKKGETIRFDLKRLLIRDVPYCRYGPENGDLPKHLPHQREEGNRSSYSTALFSISVKFIRSDVMPTTEDGEYYCNIACYGVKNALCEKVVNLSKEGGLQPGELPSSRLSEFMQKTSHSDGIGTLEKRGSTWFCILKKSWQDKRDQFLSQAKKDFKDATFYQQFREPYRNSSRYSEFCKQFPNEDFMKWTSEDNGFQVELGELDMGKLENVNTLNFNIPHLQYKKSPDKLKINAKVVFPDLVRSGCDGRSYYFTIATVIPAFSLEKAPILRETFEKL